MEAVGEMDGKEKAPGSGALRSRCTDTISLYPTVTSAARGLCGGEGAQVSLRAKVQGRIPGLSRSDRAPWYRVPLDGHIIQLVPRQSFSLQCSAMGRRRPGKLPAAELRVVCGAGTIRAPQCRNGRFSDPACLRGGDGSFVAGKAHGLICPSLAVPDSIGSTQGRLRMDRRNQVDAGGAGRASRGPRAGSPVRPGSGGSGKTGNIRRGRLLKAQAGGMEFR
jgi:hypothetical protein